MVNATSIHSATSWQNGLTRSQWRNAWGIVAQVIRQSPYSGALVEMPVPSKTLKVSGVSAATGTIPVPIGQHVILRDAGKAKGMTATVNDVVAPGDTNFSGQLTLTDDKGRPVEWAARSTTFDQAARSVVLSFDSLEEFAVKPGMTSGTTLISVASLQLDHSVDQRWRSAPAPPALLFNNLHYVSVVAQSKPYVSVIQKNPSIASDRTLNLQVKFEKDGSRQLADKLRITVSGGFLKSASGGTSGLVDSQIYTVTGDSKNIALVFG